VSSADRYADSAQARQLDQVMEGHTPHRSENDFFHEIDQLDDAGYWRFMQAEREAEKQRLKAQAQVMQPRIKATIAHLMAVETFPNTQQSAQQGALGAVMSESQELAAVPPAEKALQVFTTEKGLEPWLQQVRVKVDEFKKVLPELTTKQGRDRYASMAHQIAKSKTALEAVGKELSAKQKELPKKIDAERKRVWDILESWQKEVRQPLDDWQKAEEARIDRHREAIERIKALSSDLEGIIADDLADRISMVEAIALGDQWQEFESDAARAKDESLKTLRDTLVVRQRHEAELAEIARFNADKAERERVEHEAAIVREAAERTQREAEQRAQTERDAATKREQALIDAAERERRDAENQRLQLQLQAAQAERAAEQAEANRLAAEQRAEQERIDAEARQAKAVEKARLDELARQKAHADEQYRQTVAREADKAHKAKINRAALEAFIAGGLPESCAKQAVTLIAQRKIPATSIAY
jgi:colicin import membrane protein